MNLQNSKPMPFHSKIRFFYQSVQPRLENRTRLKLFIESLFKKEGKKLASLNYIFCTDKALLQINKQFLKHDFYTDIITFDLSEPKAPITAEVYISIDRVRDNAKTHGTTLKSELHRVIFHGSLHLCGYTDKSQKEVAIMRKKEDLHLKSYFK